MAAGIESLMEIAGQARNDAPAESTHYSLLTTHY
jgi:hypothetical protein